MVSLVVLALTASVAAGCRDRTAAGPERTSAPTTRAPTTAANSDESGTTSSDGEPAGPAPSAVPGSPASGAAEDGDDAAVGALGPALLAPSVGEAVVEIDSAGGGVLESEAEQALTSHLADDGGKAVRQAGGDDVPRQDVYRAD